MRFQIFLASIILLSVVHGHPGHDHGPNDTAIADPIASSSLSSTQVGYGFALIAIALLGTIIGASIPLFDAPIKRMKQSETNIWSKYLINITGPSFISAILAFSTGVLMYGAFSLIIPGSIQLLRDNLGPNASMTVLGLWIVGILIIFAINLLTDALTFNQQSPSCPCHGPQSSETTETIAKCGCDDVEVARYKCGLATCLHRFLVVGGRFFLEEFS